MSAPRAQMALTERAGQWRVWARPPGEAPVDITWVRGVPTQIGDWSFTDPFGPRSCELTFGAVTCYDRRGAGELYWLKPEVDITVEWDGPLPAGYPYARWSWEGFIRVFSPSSTETTVTLVGAVLQVDDGLAKPEFVTQPLPYEVAIRRQFQSRLDLRLKPLEVVFPSWWTRRYEPDPTVLSPFIPNGVRKGDLWTGLLTRQTGSFDAALTSYVQTLLASMYTERGRWTLDLLPGRRPRLHHRDILSEPDAAAIVLSALQPGVKVGLVEDWTQAANVFYGQVKGLSGEAYSGTQVVGDGQATVYKPLAALRQVEPTTDRNTWLQQHRMRKEVALQLQDGLSTAEAREVGQSQLQRFSEPGLTGTITLTGDVRLLGGGILHRGLIRAGMSVQLQGYGGEENGVMLHVTECTYSPKTGSMSLTVDSKYRDRLTVDEVRNRGRDALAVPRMLIGGKYQPVLSDLLLPWNYAEGSGYIPSSPTFSARRLFEGMPRDIEFPYSEWTTQRPPRSPSWKSCYIRIGPKDVNADKNWAFAANRGGGRYGFPIKMSQAGQIRSLQLAAYDADGNVLPVPFHFSLYYQRDVNVNAMPKIPAAAAPADGYPAGQHYPFFPQAWETYNLDGTLVGTEVPVSVASAGLIRGWGNKDAKAGYWPGASFSAGDAPTGLLVDDETWDFDLVGKTPHINQYKVNDVSPYAGFLYCMIYCDAQLTEEVFFMGRMFRTEPGSSA